MKSKFLALPLAAALALCACNSAASGASTALSGGGVTAAEATAAGGTAAENPDTALYSDRDWDATWTDAETVDCTGDEDVTLTEAGVYVLTGTLNGSVIVDAGDDDKVQLVLQNLTVASGDGPALWVKNADKVFLTLPEGTVSTLTDGTTYSEQEDEEPNAAVFCDADLTVQGSGALTIVGSYDHAVRCKDDLTVTGGDITVSAVGKGLKAKGTLAVGGGTVTVTDSQEALEANNIYITGGTVDLTASDDGMNAASPDNWDGDAPSIEISGGTVLVSAEGDGLDSNGALLVSGGVLLVAGPTGGGNGALDAEGSMTVTGGVVIAAGSREMAMNFGADSTQGSWLADTGNQDAGTALTLTDADGTVLAHWTPGKAYACAVISAPGMVQGGTYTLLTGAAAANADANGFADSGTAEGGTETASVTLESLTQSDVAGMGGGMGGGKGGRGDMGGGMGDRGDMGEAPDGTAPDSQDGTPPEKPDGETGEAPDGQDGTPPEMPDGEAPNGEAPDGQTGTPPEKPDAAADNSAAA